jgi:hypothetical protein
MAGFFAGRRMSLPLKLLKNRDRLLAFRVPKPVPRKEVRTMAKIASVRATLKEAGTVKTLWQTMPDFKMGTISLTDFNAAHDAAGRLQSEYAAKKLDLTGVRGNRDENVRALGELVTRFRSTVRGVHGPNSPVYEQAGGTPLSKRKSPKRKSKKTATTAPPAVSPTPHS